MKTFITDEVNDMYTADVTPAGKLKIEDANNLFVTISSAHTITSAIRVSSTPCYLKNVIIGRVPATAASLWLFNGASAGLEGYSAYGAEGDNVVGHIDFTVGAASAAACGLGNLLTENDRQFSFNVYCSSGLIAAVSPSANAGNGLLGCMKGVTITYQT